MAMPDARQLLAATAVRPTHQRVIVLEALLDEPGDATAQVLEHRLRAGGTPVGIATVYRTLNTLADAGIIHRLQHGNESCFRACSPGHHHHATCRDCHRVIEIRECEIDAWAQSLAERIGMTDIDHTFELHGTCSECARAKA